MNDLLFAWNLWFLYPFNCGCYVQHQSWSLVLCGSLTGIATATSLCVYLLITHSQADHCSLGPQSYSSPLGAVQQNDGSIQPPCQVGYMGQPYMAHPYMGQPYMGQTYIGLPYMREGALKPLLLLLLFWSSFFSTLLAHFHRNSCCEGAKSHHLYSPEWTSPAGMYKSWELSGRPINSEKALIPPMDLQVQCNMLEIMMKAFTLLHFRTCGLSASMHSYQQIWKCLLQELGGMVALLPPWVPPNPIHLSHRPAPWPHPGHLIWDYDQFVYLHRKTQTKTVSKTWHLKHGYDFTFKCRRNVSPSPILSSPLLNHPSPPIPSG